MQPVLWLPIDLMDDAPSEDAMLAPLKRIGFGHITLHGLSSTLKGWASEAIVFEDDLSKAALAHRVREKRRDTYKRGSMLDKRRFLMKALAPDAYASYAPP